jgi:hypothetical protein
MAVSSGYRASSKNRSKVDKLRRQLGKCRSRDWQRASMIMQQIVELTGHGVGPSGARIEPRACKYCEYYGHTRQHCAKRERDECLKVEKEIRDHKKWLEEQCKRQVTENVAVE